VNHISRNKPSREALELIATFSRAGIALEREQQDAVQTICRNARIIKRVAEARCNGHPAGRWRNLNPGEWEAWEAKLDRDHERSADRIQKASDTLPGVNRPVFQGDPRGATVKLRMDPGFKHLHDDMGREGICVPGA
jgi:hypothetical protein